MTIIRAALLYFTVVFAAGFILGTIRTLLLAPRFGDVAAVALELPFMISLSWWACGVTVRRLQPPSGNLSRLAMGLLALALLLLAEAALSLGLGGLTLAQHLELYATLPVQLGLFAQLLFALFPMLRVK